MTIAYIIFAIMAIGALSALNYIIGWRIGRQHGRDEQWVADFMEQSRRDLARRDSYGRFRSLSGKN